MRVLIAEDEITSRLMLLEYLAPMGRCDAVKNGREVVEAFGRAMEEKKPYQLVCLDIMMPGLNGREALKQIRAIEEAHGVLLGDGTKIIMITVMSDAENIIGSFKDTAEAYLTKPFTQDELLEQLRQLGVPG